MMAEEPDDDDNKNEDSPQQQMPQPPVSSSTLVAAATAATAASPFAKRAGHYMHWKNIHMTVPVEIIVEEKEEATDTPKDSSSSSTTKPQQPQSQQKAILNHVTGSAPSGQVTAIMGPSGSGYVPYIIQYSTVKYSIGINCFVLFCIVCLVCMFCFTGECTFCYAFAPQLQL